MIDGIEEMEAWRKEEEEIQIGCKIVRADVNQVEIEEEDALWNWDDDKSTCTPNLINCCQFNESIDFVSFQCG